MNTAAWGGLPKCSVCDSELDKDDIDRQELKLLDPTAWLMCGECETEEMA